MRALKSLLVMLLALGTGAGIGFLAEDDVEAQTGYPVTASVVSSAAFPLLGPADTAGAPNYSWTADTDSGVFLESTGTVGIAVGGSRRLQVSSGGIGVGSVGSAAAPSIFFTSDTDIGIYRVGANNLGVSVGGALVMDWEDTNAAGAGADFVTISGQLGIMDGSDTVRGLFIDLTNADHTGSGNSLNILEVDAFTGDAEATESIFALGDGADYFVIDPDGVALGTLTWTTNSDKDANTASGTLKVWINGALYHIQLYADS